MARVVLALVLAFVFGGADQYLGSLQGRGGPAWATEVSLLSAPWLVLAFVAGWTQREPRPAALLGLACTMSALAGYALMTLSPVEGAELTRQAIVGFVRSSQYVILGGLVTGPLFGWFGNRWRNDRAWIGALLAAGAVCLEPVARVVAGDIWAISARTVWVAEVAAGVAMTIYVARETLATRPRRTTT